MPPNLTLRTPRVHHARFTPLAFLLPALLLYGLFVALPIGESFRLSFLRWPSEFGRPVYVGLDNFRDLLYARPVFSRVFWSALWHNALLVVLSLAVQLPLAMFLAVLLSYPTRGRGVFRTFFFAPMVMPTVAIAILWGYVYLPERGLLDQAIRWFDASFGGAWLSNPNTVFLCVFVTICWRYTGFHMVIYMAGIATIPEELYEAGRIDGAGEWGLFRHVTLPLLKPATVVSATLSVIGSLKYFDLMYMMAEGAPETSRELIATYIFRLGIGSGANRFGYGSAAAVMLFVLALVAATAITRRRRGTA